MFSIVKLSDVCQIKYGKDHRSENDGEVPVYGTGGIIRYVDCEIYDKESVLIPRKGTLSSLYYVDVPFWTIDTLFYTVIDIDKIIPKYLFYYLKTVKFQEMNVGTAVPSLTVALLNELELTIPTLEAQKKITRILSNFDNKIENNNAIISNLEAQAQAIFKSWFIGFEPFQNREFVVSELGRVPKGWKVDKLGNVCNCSLGGTPSRKKEHYWNGDIGWINSGEVNKARIIKPLEYISEEGLISSSTKILPSKTTLIAITGATLGQVSLLEIDCCTNQSIVGVLENPEMPYEYIYLFIKENIDHIIAKQTGAAQQHINLNDVKNTNILLPSNNVIDNYVEIIAPVFSNITNLYFQNERLAQLRDTLLPKLMSGEIRVGNDEQEEIETQM